MSAWPWPAWRPVCRGTARASRGLAVVWRRGCRAGHAAGVAGGGRDASLGPCGAQASCGGLGRKDATASLSDRRERTALDRGNVRPHDLARPPDGSAVPSRTGGEICRCAGLGLLAGLSAPAGCRPAWHRLDRRRLRLHLGRRAVLHRQALRPAGSAPPQLVGHVDLRGGCGAAAARPGRSLVEHCGCRRRPGHGNAVSESQCRGR